MKTPTKKGVQKPSKGERLGWLFLDDSAKNVTITADMVTGRFIPENEIRSRQKKNSRKTSLLVP